MAGMAGLGCLGDQSWKKCFQSSEVVEYIFRYNLKRTLFPCDVNERNRQEVTGFTGDSYISLRLSIRLLAVSLSLSRCCNNISP